MERLSIKVDRIVHGVTLGKDQSVAKTYGRRKRADIRETMDEEKGREAETKAASGSTPDSDNTPRSEVPSISLSTRSVHEDDGESDDGYFSLQPTHSHASASVTSLHAITSPTLRPSDSNQSLDAAASLTNYLDHSVDRPHYQRDQSHNSTASVESTATVTGRDSGYSYASPTPRRVPAYPNQAFSALQQQRYPTPHLPPTLRTKTYHPAQPKEFRQAIQSLHQASRSAGHSPSVTPGLFNPTAPPLNQHPNLGPDEQGFYSSPFLHFTHRQAPKETHIADVDIDPISGRKLINNYEIIDELGRGTHGKVKLGRNLDTHEYVAIKIVERYSKKRRLGKLGNAEDKVKKEVAILKKARHPNIVALLEVIDDPARKKVYIVLERVELGEIVWRATGPKEVALIEYRRYERESRGIHDDEEAEAEDRAILDEARARRLKQQRKHLRKLRRQRAAGGNAPEAWSFEFGGDSDSDESDMERASRVSTTTTEENSVAPLSRIPTPAPRAESEATDLMTPVKTHAPTFELEDPEPEPLEGTMYGSYEGVDIMRAPSLTGSVQSFGARGLSHHGANDQYASAAIEVLESDIHPELLHVPCMTMQAARVAFRDTVLGLQYLHWQGIIHRDIKPPNLLQTFDHRVKISDFGVSYLGRPINDDQGENLSESDAQDFDEAKELAKTVGTAAFYAPELCYTDMPLDGDTIPSVGKAIDVWALGITLFCMLFGRTPFVDSEYVVMRRIADEDVYIPLKRLKPVDPRPKSRPSSHGRHFPLTASGKRSEYELAYEELDDTLLDLLHRLLIKDPEKRITLEEVRHHPWVLQDIPNKELWLDETDPSRQAQGKKIQVSKEELQDAVVPVKLVERIRSGLKKTVDGLMSGLSGRASSASSRPRAPSVSGSNPPSAGSSSTTISQDGRRGSLRGDEQIFSALQASREREHPLAQSVTASPVHSPATTAVSTPGAVSSRRDVTSHQADSTRPSPPERAKSVMSTTTSVRTIRASDGPLSPPKADSPPQSPSLLSLSETSAVSNLGGLLSGAGRRILKTVRERSTVGPGADCTESDRGFSDSPDVHGGPSIAINNMQVAGHMNRPEALKDFGTSGSAPVSAVASAVVSPAHSRSHSVAGHRDSMGLGLNHKGSSASLTARRMVGVDFGSHKIGVRSPRTIANDSTEEGFRRAEEEHMRRMISEHQEKSSGGPVFRPMSPTTCPPSPDDDVDYRQSTKGLRSDAASSAPSMETSPTSRASSMLPIMTPSSSEDRFHSLTFSNPSIPSVTTVDSDALVDDRKQKAVVGEPLTTGDAMKLRPFVGLDDDGYAGDDAVDSDEDEYDYDDSSDDDGGLQMVRRRSIPQSKRGSFGSSSLRTSHRPRRETGSSAFSKKSSRSGSNNTMKKVRSHESSGIEEDELLF